MISNTDPAIRAALKLRAKAGKAWLFNHALPLWWERGYDPQARAFHESLPQDGAPTASRRRLRVQSRQVIVYARAGQLGWTGPWADAVEHGLATLLERGLHPNGAPIHALGANGEVADPRADLYDLAFALLALAEASVALGDASLLARAEHSLAGLEGHWKLAQGGYAEGDVAPAPPRRQNPHMHLFEALLALFDASGDSMHEDLVSELYKLFTTQLLDPAGFVPEYFDDNWAPIADPAHQRIEPGHQFEWSWLAQRWIERGGPEAARSQASTLRRFAERHGVDPITGAVYDALDVAYQPCVRTSRLWPHTERIKANALAFALTGDTEAGEAAAAAFDVMMRYCDTATPGLWRDRMTPDGGFLSEPAPASSFYHIMMAIYELERTSRERTGASSG